MLPNLAQVKEFIESDFSDLLPDRIKNGWSFFYKEIRKRRDSTRIARVKQANPNRKIDFKPAVTARITRDERTRVEITTDWENEIRKVIERELELWEKHFRKQEWKL